jgi:hypothetical protein
MAQTKAQKLAARVAAHREKYPHTSDADIAKHLAHNDAKYKVQK